MFYRVKICRLCRPLYDPEILVFKPSLDQFAGVFGVIILLKNGFRGLQIVKFE